MEIAFKTFLGDLFLGNTMIWLDLNVFSNFLHFGGADTSDSHFSPLHITLG